jgi:DNA/RNA-binding domain of Phe-tRNA-synthetase-like protein
MPMHFQHSTGIWNDFPELAAGVVLVNGVDEDGSVHDRTADLHRAATERLAVSPESDFPEIQAWRRAFSRMGLKPTQYRCAAESLLRRLRKEGSLPSIHPVIDLCNAVSVAFAIPVAVFDVAKLGSGLEVRRAIGDESYMAFSGGRESPEPGEVIFADDAGNAHARRWTNRQSAYSAVRATTKSVLIVSEALHDSALADVQRLVSTVTGEVCAVWNAKVRSAELTSSAARFEF